MDVCGWGNVVGIQLRAWPFNSPNNRLGTMRALAPLGLTGAVRCVKQLIDQVLRTHADRIRLTRLDTAQ